TPNGWSVRAASVSSPTTCIGPRGSSVKESESQLACRPATSDDTAVISRLLVHALAGGKRRRDLESVQGRAQPPRVPEAAEAGPRPGHARLRRGQAGRLVQFRAARGVPAPAALARAQLQGRARDLEHQLFFHRARLAQ